MAAMAAHATLGNARGNKRRIYTTIMHEEHVRRKGRSKIGLAFGICKKIGTFCSFGAQDSWIDKERGKSVVCTLVLKT